MRRWKAKGLTLWLLIWGLGATSASASTAPISSPGRFGLGAVFGEPTGLVGKYWLSRAKALDAGLAYSFGSFILMYGDYLQHFPGAIHGKEEFLRELVPYVGIGATVFIAGSGRSKDTYFDRGSSFGFGARIPLGLEWQSSHAPIGVFLEVAPGIGLAPSVFAFVQGGLGARFYF